MFLMVRIVRFEPSIFESISKSTFETLKIIAVIAEYSWNSP